jgi:RNA polymerase sigma-70 factor (ECF subfamily)
MKPRPVPSDSTDSSWKRVEADIEKIEQQNAQLVSQAIENPDAGLVLLYDQYSRSVNRLVYRLLGPDTDHDDIVQQVFLQMIQSIGKLKSPERLNLWVRAITVNIVRSELRKRTVRRTFLRFAPKDEVTGDMNDEIESTDFMTASAAALRRLPAEERVVFLLYYLEENSLPEIAEACGFSTMTAKRRLQKARERFRRQMSKSDALESFLSGGTST